MNKRSSRVRSKASSTIRAHASRRSTGRLLPALLASGACSLLSAPSSALQLGELQVQSKLGQPLRASIAYALQPGERIANHCIYLRPGNGDGLPSITRASLHVTEGRILISGTMPISEPLAALGLAVNCPNTATLTRAYDLMLDPVRLNEVATRYASAAPQTPAATSPADAPTAGETVRTAGSSAATPVERSMEQPIAPLTSYRVQPGDSLSAIASRIDDRTLGLWPAVERLFAENPDAFIDGDIDKLKAGSVLNIPELNRAVASLAADVAPAPAISDIDTPDETGAADEVTVSTADLPDVVPAETIEETSAEPVAVNLNGNEIPSAAFTEHASGPILETPIDTRIMSIEPAYPTAEAPVLADAESEPAQTSNLLYWLAGAGMLLLTIVGALLGNALRRRHRAESGSDAAADGRFIADDEATARNPAVSSVDFDMTEIVEVSATQRAALLDADLGDGSGLDGSGDDDLTQEFALATAGEASAEVDFTLPAEDSDAEADESPTDVMPANAKVTSTILESEVLPSDDDEDVDYDLSSLAKTAKSELDLDITVRELEAITPPDAPSSEYTLNEEVDYQILEQDYEDELTATQALNNEIMRAAEELQARIRSAHADDTPTDRILAADEMPSELTAELPAVAAATAESAKPGKSIDETGATTEITITLPAAENDSDADLDIETGHFNIGDSAR